MHFSLLVVPESNVLREQLIFFATLAIHPTKASLFKVLELNLKGQILHSETGIFSSPH